MGLDMYLYARLHTSEYFAAEFLPALANAPIPWPRKGNSYESYEVQTTVAYWRKANAVHQWFVDHVQDGKDDCGDYYVSRENMFQLRDLCRDLLKSRDPKQALEKLPPQAGFFFGGTEIDEYYWEDLDETAKALTEILEAPSFDKFEYYYHSSW